MPATTPLLGLVTPSQGSLSGTWGDTVNYGITEYIDIAIAGTLSFAGDGAITLANTTGSASGTAITTTTAQYMVIRVTGTLTTPKIITGPSYSKLYMVDHAGATSAVTFKAAGQTGVSVAVGEKCFVYYNGTDYVKVASSVADGVTSVDVSGGTTGLTTSGGPITSTGTITLAGILAVANGGTGVSSLGTGVVTALGVNTGSAGAFVVNGGVLGTPSSGTLTNATGLPISTGVSGLGSGVATFLATPSSANLAAAVTNETGSGNLVFATSPTLVTPDLGTPSAAILTSATGLPLATGVTGILAVANGGTATATPNIVGGTNVTVTGTWPNQTISAVGTGFGDVVGPASATDNAITRFDLTTGKLIQNSLVTVADDGAITAPQVGSVIPFYYANQAAFPSASTYHGALAHSHTDVAMYFAHGSVWNRLLDDVTDVTVAQGGTGLSSGTSGGVLAYTASGTLASSGALTQYGVVIGGGAGAVPTSTAVGTATHVLTSNGSGVAPTFQAPAASGATKGQAIAFSMIFGL